MKAFWRRYGVLACVLLAAACVVSILVGVSALQLDPRSGSVYIGDPTAVLYGQDGQKYVIANGSTSILVLNEEDEYVRAISGGKELQGFYYAQTLTADEAGNLYIHDRLLGDDGKSVASERIAVYDSAGAFGEYLYEEPHGALNGENRNRLYGLTWQEGGLSFVRTDEDGFVLCRLDPDTGELTEQAAYDYPEAYRYLMYFVITPDLQVYFSDKMGSVWLADTEGGHTCVYNADDYGDENFYSIAANLACAPDGTIYFNDVGQREIRRILPDGAVETVIGRGDTLAEVPAAFNELPIYSYLAIMPDGTLTTIYCEYYWDDVWEESVYEYYVYAQDAQGSVLMNTALVDKAFSFQLAGWAACVGIAVLAAMALALAGYVLHKGYLSRISRAGRIQLAVIIAAMLSSIAVATILVNDLNQRYVEERTSKMTNMAVLMARDFAPEDIQDLDSPDDYGGEAYQRIDESVKKILLDPELNDDGAYCTLYREMNGIVCIIYSDEGLNNVLYPMSGVFEGTSESEIYETGELREFSAFSSADGHYAFTLAPITDENGTVIALIEVGADLYAFTAANEALIRETLLKVLMVVVTCVLIFSEATVFLEALRRNRKERRQHLLRDVGIVRPIAFLIFFAGNMSTAFLPVYGMRLWDASMGISQELASAMPLSAEVLMTAVFSLFGGFLVDWLGTKRLIGAGSVLFMGGLVLCGAAPSIWFLIGGSVVLGIGEGLVLVALNAFISNYGEEEQRNRGFSGYNAAYLSGMNCGTVAGSLAAEQLGYQKVFYLAAIVALASLVLAIVCLHKQTTAAKEEEQGGGMSTLTFLLRPRVFLFFIFMLAPYLICASFLSYFFPIYGEENGLSTSFVAQAFLLSGVIAIYLGPTLTRLVSRRLGDRGGLILATGIYVAAFALFAWNPSIGTCLFILAPAGVADGFGLSMQAVYFSALPEVRLYGSGKAMGLNSAVESIAQTVGPMIFAAVLMLGVERGVMILAAGMGVMLLVFILSILLSRSKETVHA